MNALLNPLIPARAGTQAGFSSFATENTESTDLAAPSVLSVFSVVDPSGVCLDPGFRRDERDLGGGA
jgi:hypothetical protein